MSDAMPTLSTHASRNPSKPVQPPRERHRKSEAGRATQDLRDASAKELKERMAADIDSFHDYRAEKVKEFAKKYTKEEAYFLKLLSNRSQYSASRGMTLYNAIRHDLSVKAKEDGVIKNAVDLNDDLADGEYERIKADLTPDEEKELFQQLQDHRELKRKGIRATNRSAAADAMANATRVGDVLLDLYERTGVRALAMFTRGNSEDAAMPVIVDSDQARQFFQQVLKLDVHDVVRMFEQWSCTRDAALKERHDLDTVRKEIAEMIAEGLCKIKNKKPLPMDYANYKLRIVHELGVELAGWPARVEMARPSRLLAEPARDIHQKLKTGAIHWVALTRTQRDAVAAEIEELRGQGPLRPRKERADKGRKRGRRGKKDAEDSDEEDEEVRDARGAAAPRASKSTPAAAPPLLSTTAPTSTPATGSTPASALLLNPTAPTSTPATSTPVAAPLNPTAPTSTPATSTPVAAPPLNVTAPTSTPATSTPAAALRLDTTPVAAPPLEVTASTSTPATSTPAAAPPLDTTAPTSTPATSTPAAAPLLDTTAPTQTGGINTSAVGPDCVGAAQNTSRYLPENSAAEPMPDPALFDYSLLDFGLLPPSQEWPIGAYGDWGHTAFGVQGTDHGFPTAVGNGWNTLANGLQDCTNLGAGGAGTVFLNLTNTEYTNGVGATKRKRAQEENDAQGENDTQDGNDKAAAPGTKKTRKTRCDKGVPRGRRENTADPAAERTRKKRSDAGVRRGPRASED
ncbi:hypothetical protein B0H12DRAFT_1243983 [Mycena haematopus]|nr:hypothetical protein B0H12DRAFT_1243983 [Mycena haematopus]